MKIHSMKAMPALAGLALIVLSCGLFSPTSSQPGTTGDATPLLTDNFSDINSGWGTGTDANSAVEYVNGGLEMKAFKDNYFTWSNPNTETYQDVHMEVTVRNDSGDAKVGFGLMCNQQVTTSAYDYFAITSAGEYVIGRAATAKDDVYLTNNNNWGTSNLITPNAASYHIAVNCGGGNLALYVDGNFIDSATDTTYRDGGVGLILWTGDAPAGDVTYDNFVMTPLK